jgi:hypothetical protein
MESSTCEHPHPLPRTAFLRRRNRPEKRPKLYTIFPYFSSAFFFSLPSRTFSRKAMRRAKKEGGKKKKRSENKNNFMLMYLHGSHNKNYVYMWCSLARLLTHSLSSPACVLLHVSMAALFPFSLPVIADILSFIYATHKWKLFTFRRFFFLPLERVFDELVIHKQKWISVMLSCLHILNRGRER